MSIRQYQEVRELGQGQFGDVVLAVGEVPGRRGAPGKRRMVAIKRLRERRNAESLRLLKQEFALLDQVKHRAIVRVFEHLEEEQAVVMEYVHGVTLRTVLDDCAKAREQVFTEAAIEIGCEVADALYQAWTSPSDNGDALRLVHRDLKPENIMLTPEGELKVLDFGLARVDNADFAREDARRVRGTPLYMAPEQARGEDLDHRTDLFALGLILYELLMGHPAHRIPDGVADPIKMAFAAIEAGALSDQCRELEAKLPGMGPVVARLLQANPRNRYANGQDLLVDLRRQLYRDRGSYIREFCSFYFGSLHPIGAAPDPDAPQGGKMSTDKRKTMEERLAETLDGGGEAGPRAPVPVRRAPRAVPSATPAPAPAEPAAAPRAAAPPKITPRSASAAKPAPPLDDAVLPAGVRGKPPGGGASGGSGGALKPRQVGARSPNETGMLEMVPLGNADEQEAGADPSATAFFAIPAPKSERPKTPTPSPASSPAFSPPGPNSRPPMQAPSPAFQPPPPGSVPPPNMGGQSVGMGAGGGFGGASQAGFGGQSIGLGAASGGPGGATPFNVSGPVPTAGSSEESRMQSTRVFALIIVAVGMVCLATIMAGAAVWWHYHDQETAIAAPTPVPVPVPPSPRPPAQDTGAPKVPKAPSPSPRPRPVGGPTPAPTPKLGATGTVSVTFSGSPIPGSVEVNCGSGFRERKTVSGGSAIIAGVPTSGDCKLFPKGGVVATPFSVRGGGNYNCAITGTTTKCN